MNRRSGRHWRRSELKFLAIGASAGLVLTCAAVALGGIAIPPRASATTAQRGARPLTRAEVIALIKRFSKHGPAGPRGPAGEQGPAGPSTGPAGGALSGNFPNPSLAAGAVDTTNFSPTATAPNADLLDGNDSSAFLQLGAAAGGDLQGTFPNPTISTIGGHTPITTASPLGGALAGGLPNPTLNVGGGPCPSGAFVTDLSPAAALACGPDSSAAALGQNALEADAASTNATAVGQNALRHNTTGQDNTAVGEGALEANTGGTENTAVGKGALASESENLFETALGWEALNALTTGGNNTAVGWRALASDETGSGNAALGLEALELDTASGNTAMGEAALAKNTTGFDNVAVGDLAASNNVSGLFNTALGQRALRHNVSGSENEAIGEGALREAEGSGNIAIGFGAGQELTTGNKNIDIANDGRAADSGTIRIGEANNQSKVFLAGVTGVTTGGPASPVLVDANGQLGTTSSSRRFKRDIRPIGPRSGKLMKLRPVSFRYKPSYVGGPSVLQYGLIAEQVARVYPDLVVDGKDGRPSAIAYQELPALLLAQVQNQQRQIGHLQRRFRRLLRIAHR